MRVRTRRDIDRGLDHIVKVDPQMQPIVSACREVPLRLSTPNFAGLSSIIVSQQVSKASAEAIFGRLRKLVDPLEPGQFLRAGETIWRQVGLSRPKQRTLIAVSEAILEERLNLDGLCHLPAQDAIDSMVEVKGIGPWTAEVYLLFCAGHADIFPAGDLALQEAIRLMLARNERPVEKECREIAETWSPWRGVAARLLWAYYALEKQGRDATPVG